MLNVLFFKLFEGHIASSFQGFFFSLFLRSLFNFVYYILVTTILSLEVSSSQVENSTVIFTFLIEGIVHVRDILLLLDFFNKFFYFLRESKSFTFLSHIVIDLGYIFISSLLLLLFSHA